MPTTRIEPSGGILRAYCEFPSGKLYKSDALAFLRALKSESANVVFLDPPFNIGKRYGRRSPSRDRRPESDYESWMRSILDESVRILAPGGSLFLYHLPYWAMRFGTYVSASLEFRHWIAISMKNGFVRGDRLYPAHYALLYHTKGKPVHFHRPRTPPVRCRSCDETIRDYGGYRSIIESKGVNLSDFWDDLSPVRHAKTKLRAANQLPEALTDRVVAIATRKNSVLVDPFAGTGSILVSAIRHEVRFIASDISALNCSIMKKRIEASISRG